MPRFTPGRELSGAFYRAVVRPQIGRPHAAALLGWGSDVLGFDTERSTDHGWGPRLLVFVAADDVAPVQSALDLPDEFGGWPVRYGWDDVAPQHHVTVTDLPGWLAWYPDEVWRWLLACHWRRIAREEPFVQRTAPRHASRP